MHEKSLVRSLLKQVDQLRIENKALSVGLVTVELGPLSGVEPQLIHTAFEELVTEYFDDQPTLKIRLVPLQIRCRSCHHESAVEGITLECPKCASTKIQIIRGDEFRLLDVSMQVSV